MIYYCKYCNSPLHKVEDDPDLLELLTEFNIEIENRLFKFKCDNHSNQVSFGYYGDNSFESITLSSKKYTASLYEISKPVMTIYENPEDLSLEPLIFIKNFLYHPKDITPENMDEKIKLLLTFS